MSEDKKEIDVEAKSSEETKSASNAAEKAEAAIKAAEKAEAAALKAIAKAKAAKAEAEAAAETEYKAIAAEVKAEAPKKPVYTFKRKGEIIFRREMQEPEFFLDKKDRFPRPILTADEQDSLSRKAETPKDQTPDYIPEHVLSPEYGGVSNYEREVNLFLKEAKDTLEKLKNNPETTKKQIDDIKHKITYYQSLHENYFIGMNVFRTAKGGRNKINA
jgi:colicin import membrane protein